MSRLTRRLFLGRGAAAAAAVPLLIGGGGTAPAPQSPRGGLDWALRNQLPPDDGPLLERLARSAWMPEIRRVEAAFNKRSYYRTPTLDHGIAALRSVAPQHKVAMQRRADDQHRSVMTELRRKIWPSYQDGEF